MTLILEPDRSEVVEVADHRAIRSALANLPGDPQREVVTRRDGSSLTARWDNAIGIVLEHSTGSNVREDGTPFLSSRRAESALISFARGTTGWRSTLSWYEVRSFRNPKHLMRLASRTTLPILVVLTIGVYIWSRTDDSDTVPMTPKIAGVVMTLGAAMALGGAVDYFYRRDLFTGGETAREHHFWPSVVLFALGVLFFVSVAIT